MRTFGKKRTPTYILDDVSGDFVRFSRWYHPLCPLGIAPKELPSILDNCSLAEAVLFPCSDEWVDEVARLPVRISRHFSSSVPDKGTIALFIDKWLFAQTLERLGLPHPHTLLVRNREEINQIPNGSVARYFVKPRNSNAFFTYFGTKGIRVSNQKYAIKWIDRAVNAGIGVLLQEYIPGSPLSHYFIDGFIDRQGEIRALFARRRIRMFPNEFGNSTYLISIPFSEVSAAFELLLKLFRSVQYRGIFSAEFKYDARDGAFKILEVNVRPWWYIEFAQSCNVDICGLAYKDSLGEPLEGIRDYKIGSRCVFPYFDLQGFMNNPNRNPQRFVSMIASWVYSRKVFFSRSDPIPALAQLRNAFTSRISPFIDGREE